MMTGHLLGAESPPARVCLFIRPTTILALVCILAHNGKQSNKQITLSTKSIARLRNMARGIRSILHWRSWLSSYIGSCSKRNFPNSSKSKYA